MSALTAMNGPPRTAVRYVSPKEHWLAALPLAATTGLTAPALSNVALPSKPWLAFDAMSGKVTYLHTFVSQSCEDHT